MIITITGKPCSGKGTASKLFCEKYNFEYVCTGDMFRELSKQVGQDILEFNKSEQIKKIDVMIDNRTTELGKTRLKDNIVVDSRLAWHFIPNSFKVFIDIDWDVAGERLSNTKRDTEHATSPEQATKLLKDRWSTENTRYQEIYNIDNLNLNNYDFVISSNNKTPEEVVEEIYKNYQKFIKKS